MRELVVYVKSNYGDYPVVNSKTNVPTQINIIQHLFLSYLEKEVSSDERLNLLLHILETVSKVGIPDKFTNLEK